MVKNVLRRGLFAVVLVVSAVQSRAQIQAIAPFVGGAIERFDLPLYPASVCLASRVFGHKADLCTPSGPHCQVTTSAYCTCAPCTVHAYGGTQFLIASAGVWEITFDTATLRFGGWSNSFNNSAATTYQFFDIDDHLIASDTPPTPPNCQWTWFGWDLSSGPPIKRVLAQTTGLVIMIDELQADLAPPAPAVYCTAGTTTHGCTASIAANANPMVSQASSCQLTVTGVEGQKVGVVYYGLTKQLIPWCTGGYGTSTLCVKPPIVATSPQNSGGASGQCNGTLHLDWTAYQLAHPSGLGTPWTVGVRVYVQAWFRDPPSCRSMNLSNAVVLTYQP